MSTRLGSDGTSDWSADVCVVGAGPTGLAVASGVAAAGTRVVLVEVSTPELDDVIRVEDDFGREGTSAP